MLVFRFCVLLVLCQGSALAQTAAATASQAVTADEARLRTAEQHHSQAIQFFQDQDFASAIIEFRAAYDLTKRADILFNMAIASEKLGQLTESLDYIERYLKAAPKPDDAALALREKISNQLMSSAPPQVQIATSPAKPQPPKKKQPIGATILSVVGGAILAGDVATSAYGYVLARQLEGSPHSLQTYTDISAEGSRINQAAGALLVVGIGALSAGIIWHAIAYGRQHKTP